MVSAVSEKYWPREITESEIAPGVRNYEVVIEATVSTRAEAREARFKAFDLTRDLDRAWIYACGEPLRPALMSLNVLESPEGWVTNAKEVDTKLASLEGDPYGVDGEIVHRHWGLAYLFFHSKTRLRLLKL